MTVRTTAETPSVANPARQVPPAPAAGTGKSKLHQPSWRRKRKLEKKKEHTTNILLQRWSLLTEHQFAQPCAGATHCITARRKPVGPPFILHPLSRRGAEKAKLPRGPWKTHFEALFDSRMPLMKLFISLICSQLKKCVLEVSRYVHSLPVCVEADEFRTPDSRHPR